MIHSKTTPPNPSRETAKSVLDELKLRIGSRDLGHANEAQTRLLVIDEVLELLGWDKSEFNPERAVGGAGFTDYALSIEDNPRLVVEAKRIGLTFVASRQRLKKVEYPLSYLKTAFGEMLTEVLGQAESYCKGIGIPYALVTNGSEWLIFQAFSVKGLPAEDLKGFYFGNIFSDTFQFDFFWDLASRVATASGALDEQFAELNTQECEFTRVPQDIDLKSFHLGIVSDKSLEELYQRFFGDMTDSARRAMMERCFVTSSKLDQQRKELERVLRDTKPSYLPDDAVSLEPSEWGLPIDSAGDTRGRVLLITGSVGCGKSTLVARTVMANRDKDIATLVVDLIDETSQEEQWLWESVFSEWEKAHGESTSYASLKQTFGIELAKLRHGPHAALYETRPEEYTTAEADELQRLLLNRELFLTRSWKHRKGQGRGTMVFLDNADRTSEEFQRTVYRFAHKLAKTGATVAVTMREVSYFRGKSSFLDVRSDDVVVHLEAPDLSKVVARRIDYVENHLRDDHRYKAWSRSPDWDELHSRFIVHVHVLKATFIMGADAPRKLAILAATAWHDVRLFLRYLKGVHKRLGSEAKEWEQSLIMAALLQSDEEQRPLPNIFRPALPTHPAHFLKLRLLLLLQGATVNRGLEQERILRFVTAYGYHRRWGRAALQEMVRERLVECLELPAALEVTQSYSLRAGQTFRLSPVGALILTQLAFEHAYLALLGFSLPFHRESHFGEFARIVTDISSCSVGEENGLPAIALFTESAAGVIVRYLLSVLPREAAYDAARNALPDVASVETRLRSIVESGAWATVADAGTPSEPPRALESLAQLVLPLMVSPQLVGSAESGPSDAHSADVPIPAGIATARIGSSTLGPLILWALVYLRAHGKHLVQGARVAEVINQHLAEEGGAKAGTNVSRALRKKTLREQHWFNVQHDTHGKKPRYGLKSSWKTAWLELFHEPPPAVP